MAYLRNTWYVAAWDEELSPGRLLARRLLGEPIVLFRDRHGVPQALQDRCPHRFAPLSMGSLSDSGLRCRYHGLVFDGAGRCVHNPHAEGMVAREGRLRSYPVVERYSAIWIWMGQPQRADAALIPDFRCMDPEFWHVGKRYLHTRANYQLHNDNILDLSHIEFLHPGTIGTPAVRRAVARSEQRGDTVWSYRQTVGEIMTDFLYQTMALPAGAPVDRWFDVRWDAPGCHLLYTGGVPAGRPRAEGQQTLFPHLFTPETETTTHYWFSACILRTVPGGRELAERSIEGLVQPFRDEDLPMLEAQQQRMGDADWDSLRPMLLAGDAAAVRARRILERLIRSEQGEPGAAHAPSTPADRRAGQEPASGQVLRG